MSDTIPEEELTTLLNVARDREAGDDALLKVIETGHQGLIGEVLMREDLTRPVLDALLKLDDDAPTASAVMSHKSAPPEWKSRVFIRYLSSRSLDAFFDDSGTDLNVRGLVVQRHDLAGILPNQTLGEIVAEVS